MALGGMSGEAEAGAGAGGEPVVQGGGGGTAEKEKPVRQRSVAFKRLHEFESRRQRDFSLAETKKELAATVVESSGPKFRRFFYSKMMDDFMAETVAYMGLVVRLDEERERMRILSSQANEGIKDAISALAVLEEGLEERVAQWEAGMAVHVEELGMQYSLILLAQSNPGSVQQDKLFFESFYEILCLVLHRAFPVHRKLTDREIGRIFRGPEFNTAEKLQTGETRLKAGAASGGGDPLRPTRGLGPPPPIRQLYKLRHETDHMKMNAKILASLYPTMEPSSLKLGQRNSPLVEAGFTKNKNLQKTTA